MDISVRRAARRHATASQEHAIGVAVTVAAVAAMAVDHLLGDDPGLEDPPMFLIASALSLALAAFLFGRVVPRATAGDRPAALVARDGLVLSVLAVVPGIATLWLGLPFVLAGCGLALGLAARRRRSGPRATAAILLGGLVVVAATAAYVVQAVDKLA